MNRSAKPALICIGCGYLGSVVVRQAEKFYSSIAALVATERARPALQELKVELHVGNVFAQSRTLGTLTTRTAFDLLFMLPPSAIPEAAGEFSQLLSNIDRSGLRRALLISSTGVYTVKEGEQVSAETPIEKGSARAERLFGIENSWRATGDEFSVLRLAGIYGPDRVIGRTQLSEGKPIGGSPEAWLNLMHVEDCAALALTCLHGRPNGVELGADGNPARRGEYYQFIADTFGFTDPLFSGDAIRNVTSKKCDPRSTFSRLSFTPKYSDYKTGVLASVS
ncbi:MAG: hypothetical protein AAF387_01885 [Pseudomonadota bacterium]